MNKHTVVTFGALLGALSAGIWGRGLSEEIHPPVPPPGLDVHESNAASSILGQFRTSVSSWLWLKTDLYLHNGVEMRRLSDSELASGKKGVGGAETGENALHNDNIIVTVIPEQKADFRGVFGDIERATKAYKDMKGHSHNDPIVALPLFRLMTWADPHFIPGWVTGASVVARPNTEEATNKALDLLREGLEQNPQSIALRIEMARMLIRRKEQYSSAIILLEEATKLAETHYGRISEDEAELVLDGFRWLGLAYRATERFEESFVAGRRGLELFPDDAVLKRIANPAPAIYSDEDHNAHYEALGVLKPTPRTQN